MSTSQGAVATSGKPPVPDESIAALIVGAGPAGLSTAAELGRRGIAYRLLERGPTVAHTWESLYDSLTLHTGKHMSHLPGRKLGRSSPLFPPRAGFVAYLRDYAREMGVRVETGREVTAIERDGEGWIARAGDEEIRASAMVIATGIVANPRLPSIPGREEFSGRVMHSVEYRRPDEFRGLRVLVVGVGNSGGEIGSELARNGARVTLAVRSGAHVVPLSLGGLPIQYVAYWMRKFPRAVQERLVAQVQKITERKRGAPVLPRPPHHILDAIPVIGFNIADAIRDGSVALKLAGVERFTAAGVRFTDGSEEAFDVVIFATGFTAALGALGALVRTDDKGFALRSDRVTSADQSSLYFVGHNYDYSGGISNIRRDAPLAAQRIAEQLGALRR